MELQRRKWIPAIAALLSVLISACSGSQPPAPAPSPGNDRAPAPAATPAAPSGPSGSITVRLEADWDTLDPHKMRTVAGYQMSMSLYDRLVTLDEEGRPIPSLAESWTVTDNSATFKLKQGVTCADGTALTPTAVGESLRRMGAPETQPPFVKASLGGAGYEVSADDAAGTVTITTPKPFGYILYGLAMPWTAIVCPAGLNDPAALAGEAFGTGPFVLADSTRGDSYTLTARKEYAWGPNDAKATDPGFPEKLTYRVVTNTTTALNLLLAGELDIAPITGQEFVRAGKESSLIQKFRASYAGYNLIFNQAAGRVTADRNVRTAIAMAVDQAAFLQAAAFGQGKVNTSVISSAGQCYDPGTKDLNQPFDPAGAKALLEQAGWKAGPDGKLAKDGQPLQISIVGQIAYNQGPEYVLDALTKIGITATLQSVAGPAFAEIAQRTGDFDVVVFNYNPPMPIMFGIEKFFMGGGPGKGANMGSTNNAKFNENAVAAISATADKQCGYWAEAQRALLENVDVKPLIAPDATWFARPGVQFNLYGMGNIEGSSLRRTP